MDLFEVTHYILSLQVRGYTWKRLPGSSRQLGETSSSLIAHRPVAPTSTPAVLPGLSLISQEAFLLVVEAQNSARNIFCESLDVFIRNNVVPSLVREGGREKFPEKLLNPDQLVL